MPKQVIEQVQKIEQVLAATRQDFPLEALSEREEGRRKFTSIDAYYIIERLNNVFGPIGSGWGISDLIYTHFEDYSCSVKGLFWYKVGESLFSFPAVGDTKAAKKRETGEIFGSSAEREKMATTNFISKASSFLELGVSIYKGLHDGSTGQPTESTSGQAYASSSGPAPVDKGKFKYGYTIKYDSPASNKLQDLKKADAGLARWDKENKIWWLSRRCVELEGLAGFEKLIDPDVQHADFEEVPF